MSSNESVEHPFLISPLLAFRSQIECQNNMCAWGCDDLGPTIWRAFDKICISRPILSSKRVSYKVLVTVRYQDFIATLHQVLSAFAVQSTP